MLFQREEVESILALVKERKIAKMREICLIFGFLEFGLK